MINTPIFQVDSFTDQAFTGNPAGVCLLQVPTDEAWMKGIAREMNLSETAFLYPEPDGFNLRWFTPTTEVSLCGHATLASAHILWETNTLEADQEAHFHTKSGLLTAVKKDGWIEMNFPARTVEQTEPPEGLIRGLGVEPVAVCGNGKTYLLEYADEQKVRQMEPDFYLLMSVQARGIIVTSQCTSGDFDFVSRYFAPAIGINEDPVTGAAHCYLAGYWARRLGKNQLIAYQASPRGGVVRVTFAGERVLLGGQAVTVSRGKTAI